MKVITLLIKHSRDQINTLLQHFLFIYSANVGFKEKVRDYNICRRIQRTNEAEWLGLEMRLSDETQSGLYSDPSRIDCGLDG